MVQESWIHTVTPLWARPFIASDAFAFYLYKLVWPVSLTNFYGRTPQSVLDSKVVYLTSLVPVLLAVVLFLARKRHPKLLASAGIFLAGLLPVLGFTPFMYQIHSTVADHYMYLPMIGIALAVAVTIARRPTRTVVILSCVVLAVLDARTLLQLRHWRDDLARTSHGVRLYPQDFTARASLGSALAAAGRIDEALPHFRFCVDRRPLSSLAQQRLAQALVYSNRFEQAIPHARAALDLATAQGQKDLAWEHFLLGTALIGAGQADEGQRHIAIAVRTRPDLASPPTTQ
jgi:hypothetical protein